MEKGELNVVTGALGYTGKHITTVLLSKGKRVRTLTGHPNRNNPFPDQISVASLDFDNPDGLVNSLRGAETLYNTYWVRFPRGQVSFDKAVENTKVLIEAAEAAGVRRIVHISITNASRSSHLPYFRGKGMIEDSIIQSGLTHSIIRPTVVFGPEDILINNIAWFLRRFPVFTVVGSGEYRLQPVYVEDLAEIAVSAAHVDGNIIMDAVGPEIHTFKQLVRLIAKKVGSRAKVIHLPPSVALALTRMAGFVLRDVVLTRDEVDGLMSNLLVSESPPTGQTQLSDWLKLNAGTVGTRYASELARHYR